MYWDESEARLEHYNPALTRCWQMLHMANLPLKEQILLPSSLQSAIEESTDDVTKDLLLYALILEEK